MQCMVDELKSRHSRRILFVLCDNPPPHPTHNTPIRTRPRLPKCQHAGETTDSSFVTRSYPPGLRRCPRQPRQYSWILS